MLAVRLPEGMESRLAILAEKTGRSKTFYVREAIEMHLQQFEEAYLVDSIVERIRLGKEKVFSLSEVRKEIELGN